MPVYLPVEGRVGVLTMGTSMRPQALLPQVSNIVKSVSSVIAFIKKEGFAKFVITTQPVQKDSDAGKSIIDDFKRRYDAGQITLDSVPLKRTNDQLRDVPEIKKLLALKGQ